MTDGFNTDSFGRLLALLNVITSETQSTVVLNRLRCVMPTHGRVAGHNGNGGRYCGGDQK
jgi:hypothetical protein